MVSTFTQPISLAAASLLLVASSPVATLPSCSEHFATAAKPVIVKPSLSKSARQLCFSAYSVLHSGITRSPLYAAERLTRESAEAAIAFDPRDNRFHAETRLPVAERADLGDYVGSGYDRGHMAPSGDMSGPKDDFESFSLANIIPQSGGLNRSGWAALERYVRSLAVKFGTVYIVTGPMYEGTTLRALKKRVLVPTHVWKAVYVPGQGAGAWIATNEDRSRWQVVSVAALVDRTGIDPFPTLSSATKRGVPAFPLFGDREAETPVR